MKDKGKLKHHLPSFFPTRLSFTVSFLIPLPLSTAVKVDGEWGHSSSVPFLPSHLFPLLQCGPSIGHSSFRTYSPDQTWSSPWAAVWIFAPPWSLHRLHWNLYSGTWSISHPYFCSHLGFLRTGFHFFFFLTPPCQAAFFTFSNTLSPRGTTTLAVGLSRALASPHRDLPAAPTTHPWAPAHHKCAHLNKCCHFFFLH